MARLGTNIRADGHIPRDLIQRMGARTVRIVASSRHDVQGYLTDLRVAGIRVWMVLARESFDGFASQANGIAFYADRYRALVDMWEVGNEPDIVSESSWTLAHGSFSRLIATAREVLGPAAQLCAGGLASGHPGWLGGADPSWMTEARKNGQEPPTPADYELAEHGKPVRLDLVNGVAVHPYGQAPGLPFPFVPEWYFGRVTGLLSNYRSWIDQHSNAPGLPLHISEWGAPPRDFEPPVPEGGGTLGGGTRPGERRPATIGEHRRELARHEPPGGTLGDEAAPPSAAAIERHQTYIGNMMRTLAATGLVDEAMHFCISDAMVPGFGLTDPQFNDLRAGTQAVAVLQEIGLLMQRGR